MKLQKIQGFEDIRPEGPDHIVHPLSKWLASLWKKHAQKPHQPGRTVPSSRKIRIRLAEADNDILKAMGVAAWRRLAPDIRHRFLKTGSHAARQIYTGVMTRVECSRSGWLLAQFCRLLGTPLAPHAGRDIPVEVDVHPHRKGNGINWVRSYRFPGKKPVVVSSAKVLDGNSRMMECVGAGFGMLLDVFEERRALHFRSTRYFWQGLGIRLYLPELISPGTAHVIHADMGDGHFRFTISITHKILGRLFFQDGIFSER